MYPQSIISLVALLSLTGASLASNSNMNHHDTRAVVAGSVFPPLSYSAGQISDGVSGNALAQAQALCVKPFQGVDLKTVSQTDQKNLNNFRVSAQTAEDQQFNGQVARATGAQKIALQNGKTKNKVLKLACILQSIEIKSAQGQCVADQLIDAAKKLAHNVALDVAAKGEASKGVVGKA